jgi:hypothetical protein
MTLQFQPNPDYVVRDIRGEKLLVPIEGDMGALDSLFTLNESASIIWDLASQGKSRDEIAQNLQAEFQVNLEEAEQDTDRILTELVTIEALLPREVG